MHKLAIFSVPKAFEGHTGLIQSNAIQSWNRLSGEVEIFLIGDDPGVKEFAMSQGVHHHPDVNRNENGTPLLNSVFEIAHSNCAADYMMFVNCDIILTSKIMSFLELIDEAQLESFLAIGMRNDFDQFEEISFDADWESRIENKARREGELASVLCKDYFIFRRTQYRTIPEFSIGRGNYDSWMVASAADQGIPIIDATQHVFAGHQNHDYQHVGGRMKAYLTGDEARRNIRLAAGRHYIKGSMATHRIGVDGQMKRINRFPILRMVRDSPRILKQLLSFIKPVRHDQDLKRAA